jgi:hypothetical protein
MKGGYITNDPSLLVGRVVFWDRKDGVGRILPRVYFPMAVDPFLDNTHGRVCIPHCTARLT